MERNVPYDQRLARFLVRPFSHTALHPNHLTTLTLLLGIAAALLFAFSIKNMAWLASLLYMLAVFSDHLDGELARLNNKTSKFGHDFDYVVGGINYTLLFISIGYGLYSMTGQTGLLILGLMSGISNPVILAVRMRMESQFGKDTVVHPGYAGFEIEDFIYLIGPITWVFGIMAFFIPYALGTTGYLIWIINEFNRCRKRVKNRALHGTQDLPG